MPAPTSQRVLAAVDDLALDATALLQELVRTPSLTGSEEAAQLVVARFMREIGLDVDVWEPDPRELAPYAEHVGEFETMADPAMW